MSLADHSTTAAVEKRVKEASREINLMAPLYGMAKQVLKYDSDRRKALLAKYAAPYIEAGKSVAAAKMLAQADPKWIEEQAILEGELLTAHETIAKWEALHIRWETGRSLMALTREQLKTFPE